MRNIEILEAACRVIARGGADRLRMSDVAQEAGVSSALVHYYFDTRADLLAQAFSFADERVDARVEAELAQLGPAIERLEAVLRIYLSEDEVVRENAVLWREMWSHSAFEPALRERLVSSYGEWIEQVEDLIRESVTEGTAPRSIDVGAAARRLAAIVDGLAAQVLLQMIDGAAAGALIRDALRIELATALDAPT